MVSNLVLGLPKTTKKSARIREKSFKNLIEHSKKVSNYRNEILNEKGEKFELYTPLELFEINPRVQLLNWSPAKIGMFLNNGLLIGINNGLKSPSLIDLQSYYWLIEFANKILDSRKVYLNKVNIMFDTCFSHVVNM